MLVATDPGHHPCTRSFAVLLRPLGPVRALHAGEGLELIRGVANLIGAPPPLTGPGTR